MTVWHPTFINRVCPEMAHVWWPQLWPLVTLTHQSHWVSDWSLADNLALWLDESDPTHAPICSIPSGHDGKRRLICRYEAQLLTNDNSWCHCSWPIRSQCEALPSKQRDGTFRMGDHHTSALCNQDPVNTHIYMQWQCSRCGASRAKYYKCLHLSQGQNLKSSIKSEVEVFNSPLVWLTMAHIPVWELSVWVFAGVWALNGLYEVMSGGCWLGGLRYQLSTHSNHSSHVMGAITTHNSNAEPAVASLLSGTFFRIFSTSLRRNIAE